tara:strand:- start:513 stop:650 length:138 start_codon:yes stop_codon:yes gene_type:complete
MSDCCTRERKKKDYLFLPLAISCTLVGFALILSIEIGIAYAMGWI